MKHHKTRTVLSVLAIVTTVLFIVEISVNVAGIAGTPVVTIVWTIVALLLLPIVLSMLCPIGVNIFHVYILEWEDREDALRQKKADREHYYAHRRRMRALVEERYRRKYCQPVYRQQPRRVRVLQRPFDPKDYGC